MNAFTKDELIKIRNGVDMLADSNCISNNYAKECQKIIEKIDAELFESETLSTAVCAHDWCWWYPVNNYLCIKCHKEEA